MRAVGINKYGDLDAIEELTLPVPKPGPNEILVKVRYLYRMSTMSPSTIDTILQVEYGGVNWLDTGFRSGNVPFHVPPPPKPLGGEAAGTIVALPTDEGVLSNEDYRARGFRVGDKVAIVSALFPMIPPSHLLT